MPKGYVIWLTGLPASGKSTLALALQERLRSQGLPVVVLDGDEARRTLSADLGFSPEDRERHNLRVIQVSKLLVQQGFGVIVPLISPYRAIRARAREELERYLEVYVRCPLEECIRRDPKGLYARARRGEIQEFTGISAPYEEPERPEVTVDTDRLSVEECVQRILEGVSEKGYIMGGSPHGGVLVDRRPPADEAERLRQLAPSLPGVTLDRWALNDLYMIGIGAFSPLRGFLQEEDYRGVVESMRLDSGLLWPLPVGCPLGLAQARQIDGAELAALRDEDGRLVGVMEQPRVFEIDPRWEARHTYGTEEDAHPGVALLYRRPPLRVGGRVWLLEDLSPADFREENREPAQTRAIFRERGWRTVVGFQTRNPVHRAHEYIQKCALEVTDGLLLHPLVGETKEGDVPAEVRMRAYKALLEHYYPRDRVLLSVYPAYMRYAGPREAVFHALVRKNYGCTHFIVGRDHAGVGGYYGPYDAQQLLRSLPAEELAITPLFFEDAFFCRRCGNMATAKTCPHPVEARVSLSGTQVRAMLARGEAPPPEFTRPEVARTLWQG